MSVRVLLAGGGTGGHLFPALAIGEELQRQGAQVLFVGTPMGIEAKKVPERGFELKLINVAGFKRKNFFANLMFPIKLLRSFWQSWVIVNSFQPHAVLGTGGYVCGPVLLAATLKRIPIFLQEQNSYPGVTTRLLARWARKVFLNFEEAAQYLPKRASCLRVGNPVRVDFAHLNHDTAVKDWGLNPDLPTLLVFGGSQGAMSLNRTLREALPRLGGMCNLIWARGERDIAPVEGWTSPGILVVKSFIENMPSAYAAADLAVCRSGALTLSELQAAQLPAILIPYPHAAADHQRYNAMSYAQSGSALVLEDRDLNAARFLHEVENLLGNKEKLITMHRVLSERPRENAAEIIVNEILETVRLRDHLGAQGA